jgi:hypothetical protein
VPAAAVVVVLACLPVLLFGVVWTRWKVRERRRRADRLVERRQASLEASAAVERARTAPYDYDDDEEAAS